MSLTSSLAAKWCTVREDATPLMFHVERAARRGVRRWRVVRADGTFARACDTRIEARLVAEVMNGYAARSPELYRRWVREAARRGSEEEAWRYAALSARLLGLGPDHVQADPDTGRPL